MINREVNVKITNSVNTENPNLVTSTTKIGIFDSSIRIIYEDLRRKNPNSIVTFRWKIENGENHIENIPYNQELDEELMRNKKMTMKEFTSKWFPQLKIFGKKL